MQNLSSRSFKCVNHIVEVRFWISKCWENIDCTIQSTTSELNQVPWTILSYSVQCYPLPLSRSSVRSEPPVLTVWTRDCIEFSSQAVRWDHFCVTPKTKKSKKWCAKVGEECRKELSTLKRKESNVICGGVFFVYYPIPGYASCPFFCPLFFAEEVD